MLQKGSDRFIPNHETVLRAAAELPPADEATTASYEVAIAEGRTLTFKRIKLKDASGRGYRWIYDGKILVQ